MANNIKKHQITQEGLDNLNKEYRELIEVKRPANTKALQEAREQGDLSENADYDAAKTEQAEIEKRIAEIKNILDHYEIISNVKRYARSFFVSTLPRMCTFPELFRDLYFFGDINTSIYINPIQEAKSQSELNKVINELETESEKFKAEQLSQFKSRKLKKQKK